MKHQSFIEKAFWSLISISVTYFCYGVRDEMKKLNISVSDLNIQMATVVTKVSTHDMTVTDHEHRIRGLERKK